MKQLKIIQCNDGMMWYNTLVGTVVPYVRDDGDVYMSREPAGYINIVRKEDAVVIDDESQNDTTRL